MDRLDRSLEEIAKERSAAAKSDLTQKIKVAKAAQSQKGAQKIQQAKPQRQPASNRDSGRDNRDGRDGRDGGRGRGNDSILSRVGRDAPAAPIGGTLVLFKNLKFDVNDADIQELARTVGEIKKGSVGLDPRTGRSTGIAEVVFAKRSDAMQAVKKFNGLTLDGRPMDVVISDDHTPKAGMFGSALGGKQTFSVVLSDPIIQRGGYDRYRDDDRRDGRTVRNDRSNDRRDDRRGPAPNSGNGNGNGNGNGGGNARKPKAAGAKAGGKKREAKETPSMADLDRQLEAYSAKA